MTEEGLVTLLRVVERSKAVADLSNREVAEILIEMTGETRIDSYTFNFLMEVAERICPELFDENDPQHPSYKGETK